MNWFLGRGKRRRAQLLTQQCLCSTELHYRGNGIEERQECDKITREDQEGEEEDVYRDDDDAMSTIAQ